jgi:hypothetical protein
MNLDFMQCDACADNAGRYAGGRATRVCGIPPALCDGCRHNRAVIGALLAEVPSPSARAAAREDARRSLAGGPP